MQFKRTWVISESFDVLEKRWKTLLASKNRSNLFKETRDRKVNKQYPTLDGSGGKLTSLKNLNSGTPALNPTLIAYRSFDRQWALVDNRLGDYLRPNLQRAHSSRQLYLTSLLTNVLGEGSSAILTNLIPDLDHFRGSFGAKHVIPLWQEKEASTPNIAKGVLEKLQNHYGINIPPENFFAYAYAVLFSPDYVQQFWEELTIPGLRLPITKDYALFETTVHLGRQLIFLHTYGDRCVPKNKKTGRVP